MHYFVSFSISLPASENVPVTYSCASPSFNAAGRSPSGWPHCALPSELTFCTSPPHAFSPAFRRETGTTVRTRRCEYWVKQAPLQNGYWAARTAAAQSKMASRLSPASAYMAKMFSMGVSGGIVCEAARM